MTDQPASNANCTEVAGYSHVREFVANVPYLLMLMLGAAIIFLTTTEGLLRWLAALGYVLYGLAGSLWIIAFVCPFCHFYDTRQCPCGYGQFAPKFAARQDGGRFAEKFRRHIPVIVPLWLIPPAAGAWTLISHFSIPPLLILIAFLVNSYAILPLLSKRHCCASCPQKTDCPWMRGS